MKSKKQNSNINSPLKIAQSTSQKQLEEDADYYINSEGKFVFTQSYHLKRGYCCKNGCLHCPYDFKGSTESF